MVRMAARPGIAAILPYRAEIAARSIPVRVHLVTIASAAMKAPWACKAAEAAAGAAEGAAAGAGALVAGAVAGAVAGGAEAVAGAEAAAGCGDGAAAGGDTIGAGGAGGGAASLDCRKI